MNDEQKLKHNEMKEIKIYSLTLVWFLQLEGLIQIFFNSFSKEIKWILVQIYVNENFSPKSNLGLILVSIFFKWKNS
jgi:hypothetical protein